MKKKYLLKYSLEFLIIVLGITVSFWINQAASSSEFQKQKLKIINNLQIEIDQIYNYCLERKNVCKKDIDVIKLFIGSNHFDSNLNQLKDFNISKSRIEFVLTSNRSFDPPSSRYRSIINSGDIKYLDSDNIKEYLSRVYDTYFSYVRTNLEYEKQLKQTLTPYLLQTYPEIILERENNTISVIDYYKMLFEITSNDKTIEANLILLNSYLQNKINYLELYIMMVEELEMEIQSILN
ncbi:MAG: hypothetical protein CM15mP23_03380 [Cryomorphaceae bacterium]|nr:MAG: hypothetical protein CM15mP23_03380 [Cryomorphaceae bacterium]|tara:strand:- start:268 stop:978 length:711 start_codon:yes stop_codon:yes gene_type:complete